MSSKSLVVLIPIYKVDFSADELRSLEQLENVLPGMPRVFVAPVGLKISRPGYKVEYFPSSFFENRTTYSELLVHREFYERFSEFDFALIYQTDALIVKDDLKKWCQLDLDYVGGYWDRVEIEKYERCTWDYMEEGCGNGGFSLRKISSAISALQTLSKTHINHQSSLSIERQILNLSLRYNEGKAFNLNEDIFWCTVVPRLLPHFTLGTAADALQFAFEYNPTKCFEMNAHELPLGAHAWNKFEDSRMFWLSHLRLK